MPASYSSASWTKNPKLLQLVAHVYNKHKKAQKTKYHNTIEELGNSYGLIIYHSVLKRSSLLLDNQLATDEEGPDVNLDELYEDLSGAVRSMQTMATPSEIAAAMEDKNSSPQAIVRTLASAGAVERKRAASQGSAPVRSLGFEDAVLAHLGTVAGAMTSIAAALGAKPKAVVSALQLLNSGEGEEEDAQEDEDDGEAAAPGPKKKRRRAHKQTAESEEEVGEDEHNAVQQALAASAAEAAGETPMDMSTTGSAASTSAAGRAASKQAEALAATGGAAGGKAPSGTRGGQRSKEAAAKAAAAAKTAAAAAAAAKAAAAGAKAAAAASPSRKGAFSGTIADEDDETQ